MSQTRRNTKGCGEDQSSAVLSQYCDSLLPQKLHLILQKAGRGMELHRRCKTMLSFGRELLVLCLHTGSDTLLEGASGGSQPGMRCKGQPALASLCPGLLKDQCALSCISPVPWYAAAFPVTAAVRAERERGLMRSPAACPGAAQHWC